MMRATLELSMNIKLIKSVEKALSEKTTLKGWEHLTHSDLDMALTFCALGAWMDRPSQDVRNLAQVMLTK
jgi:hypothetical protein